MSSKYFNRVNKSLSDILGDKYLGSVRAAGDFFRSITEHRPVSAPDEKIDFYPEKLQSLMPKFLDKVGKNVVSPLLDTAAGAGSAKFCVATKTAAAPLNACGYYRIGEDGRLYLITKSEHYHAPLGHSFPGYALLERASSLGIPNATHNNTRGYITRLLEEELIRIANGIECGDKTSLNSVLAKNNDLRTMNRVLNLETGSLAVEAAIKMVLARFYRIEAGMTEPLYSGQIPVILVMGNDDGALQANYHGTTVLAQMTRGMWPELNSRMENSSIWKILPIRPNSMEDLDNAFAKYEKPPFKIAGFFHEIVMMNYGGRRLTEKFLHHAYELCEKHETPVLVDEIQSCMWAPQLFMFREYGLRPSMVAVGKGFPGGEYPASRILFSSVLDLMPQFGALVTNGQEEIASLAYLITMEWALANAEITSSLGTYFENCVRSLADEFPSIVKGVDGWRHMTTICFASLQRANAFAGELNRRGLDISAQIYKADCPPVVLTKLPLTADQNMIDFVLRNMREVLSLN